MLAPRAIEDIDARKVLEEITNGNQPSAIEIYAVVEYVRGFGLAHLTRDPDMFVIFDKLSDKEWHRITNDEWYLFAMTIIDETEV
jgi:hypothetical protein